VAATLIFPQSLPNFSRRLFVRIGTENYFHMLHADRLQDPKYAGLLQELADCLSREGFEIKSAAALEGYQRPTVIKNTGFGDQENKYPDVVGFDPKAHRYAIGVVRATEKELDTEDALTQYNLYLDLENEENSEPHYLYIVVPSSLVQSLTALITHYIHREYWHRVYIVSSKKYHV